MTIDTKLDGRTALITGGSNGLGFAVAQALKEQGAAVAILARNEDQLKTAESQLSTIGSGDVLSVSTDVTDDTAVADALRKVLDWRGRLDIVVNTAAPGLQSAPLADTEESVLSNVLDGKLVGYARVSRAALPHIETGGTGRIINIAGMTAHTLVPGTGVSAIANAGVVALTSYFAAEAAPKGILVNGISPGMTLTQSWRGRHEAMAKAQGKTPDEVRAGMVAGLGIRLGRWAEPAEIAAAAVFLASDLASYVTGQVLHVDGGLGKGVI
ncbi:SDR family NAD(P)-dependent oxidoreductase [Mycolicibacterium chlorophenolicum]|uniref:3-oxoacyl-[acyl-carrier-protein] reductase FabG n=1 Tax=Mycolicibacterium chlorophenolicum TaxID=37916 RepID=A0A0J6VBS8_9MYCO|nr:SDR family oxidoreductase [Mycolicibacterium chlorophenolicum]KMO66993.1 3-oxoacyl-[acyl-carrier-protein] reductase FabG [Mycolicibacterium chlorophenolicum]